MVVVAFLFSEKECLVVGKDENIEQRVVEYSFSVVYLERGHFFMPSFDFWAEFNNTRNTFFSRKKCCRVRALFEVSAFSANELSREKEGEKAAFRLHLCLVLLALVAPPIVLKTDFFSGKRAWRRKAERRGS